MTLPFGIDVSSYQANKERTRFMDWLKARTEGVKFAFVKATEGSTWVDPTFNFNWAELRRLGIPHGAYHYFRPKEDALLQAQEFVDIVDPEAGELLVLDVENAGGLDRKTLTNCVVVALETIYAMTGRYPILYSRALWLNANIDVNKLPRLDYWLAQYRYAMPFPIYTSEYPTDKLTAPAGIERQQIKFHQSGEKGNGGKFGAQSYYIDCNRFVCDPDSSIDCNRELVSYFGVTSEPQPEPQPLYEARVKAWKLIVRDAPAGKDTKKRRFEGDIVKVYEEREA